MELLAPKDLVKGRVYKIESRNLNYGVYDGALGFTGICEQEGERYLFTEFHEGKGITGTVTAMLDTKIDLPEDVDSRNRDHGSVDADTGRDVDFVEISGNFVWAWADSLQPDPSIKAVPKGNMALKEFMEMIEEQSNNV